MGAEGEVEGEEELQARARELLRSRLFLGRYAERRLVSRELGYRDLVLLSAAEEELARDLLELRARLCGLRARPGARPRPWFGITDTALLAGHAPGVCLWTELQDVPLGVSWFQIRTLQFREDEVCVRLRCVRHITPRFLELEPLLAGARHSEGEPSPVRIESLARDYKDLVVRMRAALTVDNVKDFFTFLFALMIALVTGSMTLLNFIGNFVLAFLRETSVFVKNSTPLFLGFLEFISKIVGGFYILLAMLFRQTSPQPSSRQLAYYRSGGGSHKNNEDYDSYPRDFD